MVSGELQQVQHPGTREAGRAMGRIAAFIARRGQRLQADGRWQIAGGGLSTGPGGLQGMSRASKAPRTVWAGRELL